MADRGLPLAGAFSEVILAISVIGTAVTLFPIVKRQSEGIALGYVAGQVVEAVVIIVGIMSLLSVVTLAYLMYRSGLVPRLIAVVGLIGARLQLGHHAAGCRRPPVRSACGGPGRGHVGTAFLGNPVVEAKQRRPGRDLPRDQALALAEGDRALDQARRHERERGLGKGRVGQRVQPHQHQVVGLGEHGLGSSAGAGSPPAGRARTCGPPPRSGPPARWRAR